MYGSPTSKDLARLLNPSARLPVVTRNSTMSTASFAATVLANQLAQLGPRLLVIGPGRDRTAGARRWWGIHQPL